MLDEFDDDHKISETTLTAESVENKLNIDLDFENIMDLDESLK